MKVAKVLLTKRRLQPPVPQSEAKEETQILAKKQRRHRILKIRTKEKPEPLVKK